MPAPFPRTLRSLREDGLRAVATPLAVGTAILVAWASWFSLAEVRIYERSEVARVEVDGAAQAIQTPVSARVVASYLVLGRTVRAGEVLVELDSQAEALALDEATRRREASAAQLEFLRAELDAASAATRQDRSASRAALGQARAKVREAEARRVLASEEASRLGGLRDGGNVGEMELLRATSEAQTRQASAEASALDVPRLEWALRTSASDRLAALARLRRDIAMLEGDEKTAMAAMSRLAHEVERRKLRSPVEGRIGEMTPLREGSVVHDGDRLASVVPKGELRVIAEFAQATAVGRLRPGQEARVRLTGFNWAEYGVLSATVASVATEATDAHAGRIRAELRLAASTPDRIPLQHGLSGVVDVEIERATPARLVLRTAGSYLAPPPMAPTAVAPPGVAPTVGNAP